MENVKKNNFQNYIEIERERKMYYIFRCYQTFMSADIIQLKIIRLDNDSQCIRERDRESRERER